MTKEMREPTFYLLMALLGGRKHGYGLIAEVKSLSSAQLSLQVGTLYGALERLERQGWVRESGTEVVSGRHRRYFEITDAGAIALEEEAARLKERSARVISLLSRRAGYAG